MSRTRLLPAALLVVVALAGCAAGQGDVTSHERATPYVADANVGKVNVRAVTIAASASGNGTAQGFVSMVVLSSVPDRLVGVSLDAGGTVTPTDPTADLSVGPNHVLTIANPETPTTDPGLAINGLQTPPVVGTTMRVTITFQTAGSVVVVAPVRDAPQL